MGVQTWIHEFQLSSGMSLSLQYIAELYLCADNTVILIDEFENSLGINCIDAITDSIVAQKRDLQFILTSHHPYIINNINPENWKIIARKGGSVRNYNAEQLDIGKSKHAAFTQLINLDEYADGIEI
jgi:predicted ATPase